MLNRLPRYPAPLREILPEIGNPSAADLGKALGVSERTARRWMTGRAPRVALLALWWLTPAGMDAADCEASRAAQLAQAQARAQAAQLAQALDQLAQALAAAGTAGAANDVLFAPLAAAATAGRPALPLRIDPAPQRRHAPDDHRSDHGSQDRAGHEASHLTRRHWPPSG